MVAFGALWAGWRAVEELRGRVRAAEAVIDGLELLERELWERGTALPELLEDLSSRTRENSTGFLWPAFPCPPFRTFNMVMVAIFAKRLVPVPAVIVING